MRPDAHLDTERGREHAVNEAVAGVVLAGLLVLRSVLPAYPPAAVDAHVALAVWVLALGMSLRVRFVVAASLWVLAAVLSCVTSWDPG